MDWMVRFLRFHRTPDGTWRHPSELRRPEISEFLTHLAVERQVSASTQNKAICAIVFLYRQVLELDPGRLDGVRARGPEPLPVVLSHMVHSGLLWVEAETAAVEKDRRFEILAVSEAAHTAFD